jgi:LPXTG-motif cell wall-anchored protein
VRRQLPDTNLAQAIAWIWLGFLLAGLVAWLVYRYWRKRHPVVPPAPERSYSQRLEQRLTKSQGSAKRKRCGGTAKGGKRRL